MGGIDFLYVLSTEVGPNDSFETATPIVPPVLPSIDALIFPPGDLDYYRVAGNAGQVLTVDIDSAVFNPAQPAAKIVLAIYDPARVLIAQDAYTSSDENDPFLQVTLATGGTYTILVRELRTFVGTPNTFYQMSVNLTPALDDGTFATGAQISLPRAVSGVVSPSSDVDHFRFSIPGSLTVRADLDARPGAWRRIPITFSTSTRMPTGTVCSSRTTIAPLFTTPIRPIRMGMVSGARATIVRSCSTRTSSIRTEMGRVTPASAPYRPRPPRISSFSTARPCPDPLRLPPMPTSSMPV